jgi:hypothetical protein
VPAVLEGEADTAIADDTIGIDEDSGEEPGGEDSNGGEEP